MADILVYNALGEANLALRLEMGDFATRQEVLSNPDLFAAWPAALPSLTTETGSICVFDNVSGFFRCGGCCQWTVPAGATKVRFQLWGAGAGTQAGMCCGGTPWGPTGAYASVIVDAVPGCQYTLCGGCAHCYRNCCTQSCDVSGAASFVTGFGLTGFCADGGCTSLARNVLLLSGFTCCRYQARGQTIAGACICCGGETSAMYCFSNSCASCGPIVRVADTARCGRGTATTGTVFYIPSVHASIEFDTNHFGTACTTPTMLPNGTVSPITNYAFTSGTCCGPAQAASTGTQAFPGQGGSYTHAMGGSVDLCADWGRTGMVRVSWC